MSIYEIGKKGAVWPMSSQMYAGYRFVSSTSIKPNTIILIDKFGSREITVKQSAIEDIKQQPFFKAKQ